MFRLYVFLYICRQIKKLLRSLTSETLLTRRLTGSAKPLTSILGNFVRTTLFKIYLGIKKLDIRVTKIFQGVISHLRPDTG